MNNADPSALSLSADELDGAIEAAADRDGSALLSLSAATSPPWTGSPAASDGAGPCPWSAGWAVACVCSALLASSALAEVVPIGRYVEIRGGAGHRHPYAMSGGDVRRTGRSRARVAEREPQRVWIATLPQRRLVPPAVLADGTLMVGGSLGVLALDPRTGAQRWFATIGAVRFTPSVAPDGSLTAVAGGVLFAIDANGSARELELPFDVTGAALVLDSGELIVAGRDGRVHAVAADGTHLGGAPAPRRQWTALAGGDLIAAAGAGAELTLLSPQDGSARTLELPARLATGPVVGDDEVIWVLGDRGGVWLVAAGGELREIAQLGETGFSGAPALGWDGALRAGLRHGEIVCLEPSGTERWRRGIDSPPGAMSIDVDDTLLVVSTRGTLYAIDRHGELRWRKSIDVRTAGRPVLARDGTVYVVSRSGDIQALR
jgi:outer membrane protein assembly factor BamB